MARREDPLPVFCFRVEINGLADSKLFFKSVSGLTYETEVVDYKEGGQNLTTRRLVGATKWPNIVLKKGFTGASGSGSLITWRREWMNESATAKLTRQDGKIIQLSNALDPLCAWKFRRGWPCKWVGPEYDASKAELAIETLEIAHEGLTYIPRESIKGY